LDFFWKFVKIDEPTINFDQKQSILTQGAQKTPKTHQTTIKFDQKTTRCRFRRRPPGAAASRGSCLCSNPPRPPASWRV